MFPFVIRAPRCSLPGRCEDLGLSHFCLGLELLIEIAELLHSLHNHYEACLVIPFECDEPFRHRLEDKKRGAHRDHELLKDPHRLRAHLHDSFLVLWLAHPNLEHGWEGFHLDKNQLTSHFPPPVHFTPHGACKGNKILPRLWVKSTRLVPASFLQGGAEPGLYEVGCHIAHQSNFRHRFVHALKNGFQLG